MATTNTCRPDHEILPRPKNKQKFEKDKEKNLTFFHFHRAYYTTIYIPPPILLFVLRSKLELDRKVLDSRLLLILLTRGRPGSILSLRLLIPLLIRGSLRLVWLLVFCGEAVPALTEDLADLACRTSEQGKREEWENIPKVTSGFSVRTTSRLSAAKNMYAERERLGALGSIQLMWSAKSS
ncbi:hypothetical protein G7K_1872-t1 [Saitoella complicata NRRL Y-17804]|uniref:Uncharacterized protein n=1 Tax=Saitoella complicata (strain BCRC 22490 / CBS 7301 / JCM 7358 / NBRC 10748 / NRRL Y-17804) TaxID=698492 RepID=A0A0E9NCZ4_SAICN|nr:hypothetical protein G7K_1872-t1 [Saitoella complicata NRRL Y-17804]